MNRIFAIVSATFLALLILVPVAAAADPWDVRDEHVVLSTGGDITLAAGQQADILIVVNGTATIEGDAGSVVVINGTANFVGSSTAGIVAIRSHVTLDAGSNVDEDVVTFDSVVDTANGAAIQGEITDLAKDLGGAALLVGSALALVYLAFVVSAIAAAVVLAGVAGRQVREAGALISVEPVKTVIAGLVGIVGTVLVGTLAILTIVGMPLGFGILALVLPVLLVAGYLVAGIWIGDMILAQTSPGVVRERPYLAAVLGVAVVGVIGIIPVIGSIPVIVGVGAVVLAMSRAVRRPASSEQVGAPATAVTSAG